MAHSAPGKHYREGISLLELTRMFPDDATAEQWFIEQRWPDGVYCPKCGSFNVAERKTRKPQPYRCRDCRKDFSVKTGTLMHSSNLGFQTWAMAIYLLATNLKGVSSLKLHRDLDIRQATAWHLAHRIRETWKDNADLPFAGPTEVDETYVGGKRGNMPARKRAALMKQYGGGPTGKAIVAGAKDRTTKKVRAEVVPNTKKVTLQDFVEVHTKPGSRVYTDENQAYRGMSQRHHKHTRHTMGQWVDGQAHTNGIESFWSMLKRGYHGTYHYMSHKHLPRYLQEFAGRHNVRELDTVDQMSAMAAAMDGKVLGYKDLIDGKAAKAT